MMSTSSARYALYYAPAPDTPLWRFGSELIGYDAATGKITVPAGVTSFAVTVPTTDDTTKESTETVPVTIGGVSAVGSILDNDLTPTIKTVEPGQPGTGDDSVTEGTSLVFNVSLSNGSDTPTSFDFKLGVDGTATAVSDYGSPSFSNGVTYDASGNATTTYTA